MEEDILTDTEVEWLEEDLTRREISSVEDLLDFVQEGLVHCVTQVFQDTQGVEVSNRMVRAYAAILSYWASYVCESPAAPTAFGSFDYNYGNNNQILEILERTKVLERAGIHKKSEPAP